MSWGIGVLIRTIESIKLLYWTFPNCKWRREVSRKSIKIVHRILLSLGASQKLTESAITEGGLSIFTAHAFIKELKAQPQRLCDFPFLNTNNRLRISRLFSTRRLRINASRCSSWKQGQNYQVNFWNGIHRDPEYEHEKSPDNNHNHLFQTFLLCCSSKINIGHPIRNFFHLNSNSVQVLRLVDQKLQYLGWNWSGLHSLEENRTLSVVRCLSSNISLLSCLHLFYSGAPNENIVQRLPNHLNIPLLNVF